ncbi:hypothetical protein [Methylobacterium dankookense]|uniref:Uncharacterized protein n=1 Tax=Methylobacterium dankookense TaxID=560405 RepID=A0A564FXX9_9HYPH|nr:hypothetical protein [Methylobacterium dankookense]GJD55947.1 hypothetical protein IFDJLNFL_1839 [Methylobacterium dankookense]VUF12852.1 hypothetical protein MTDSW087_02547 [Methylobacterium dankookense]
MAMRMIPMVCVLALTGLHATEAEARRLRLRFGVTPSVALPAVAAPVAAVARPEASPEPAEAPAPRLRVAQPVSAPPPAPPVKVAGPWCAGNRVVGSGAGFCELN